MCDKPGRTSEESQMNEERSAERDAKSVEGPEGAPPNKGLTYDPTLTDTDEANVPPGSDSDPHRRSPEHEEAERQNRG